MKKAIAIALLVAACGEPIEESQDFGEFVCEAYDEQQGEFVEVDRANETCEQLAEDLDAKLNGYPTRFRSCDWGSGWGNTLDAGDCKAILNCKGIGEVAVCGYSIGPASGLVYGNCACGYAH